MLTALARCPAVVAGAGIGSVAASAGVAAVVAAFRSGHTAAALRQVRRLHLVGCGQSASIGWLRVVRRRQFRGPTYIFQSTCTPPTSSKEHSFDHGGLP